MIFSRASTETQTLVSTTVTLKPEFARDVYGFWRQIDPKPFNYDLDYKAKQSTNQAMDWLRLGWLSSHIQVQTLKTFNVVDIGAGNGSFVMEASKVFRRVVPYDLVGESISEQELRDTLWDLISLSDVLEHYHNIDDLWSLHFKYAFISFPETPEGFDLTKWRHYKPDEHIYMINAASFALWVQRWGCQVVAAGCPEDMLRVRWDPFKPNISTFLIRRD